MEMVSNDDREERRRRIVERESDRMALITGRIKTLPASTPSSSSSSSSLHDHNDGTYVDCSLCYFFHFSIYLNLCIQFSSFIWVEFDAQLYVAQLP
jgi:hypothetical protein